MPFNYSHPEKKSPWESRDKPDKKIISDDLVALYILFNSHHFDIKKNSSDLVS